MRSAFRFEGGPGGLKGFLGGFNSTYWMSIVFFFIYDISLDNCEKFWFSGTPLRGLHEGLRVFQGEFLHLDQIYQHFEC